ncbi:MAG: AAA family ATPase [Oceanibaculum sp.]
MTREDDIQAKVIAFLRDPTAHGGVGPVEIITTHASVIFLVGDRAYKLKRAVTYSFLDYGTVSRREAACRAELTLNRRTAPGLYLGVRAIRRRPEGDIGWEGEGEILDWVVEMARFPQEALFSHLVETGGLSAPLLRSTADAIAHFHAAAEVTPDFGGAAGMATVLSINAGNMREVMPSAAVEQLIGATEASFAARRDLLERRRMAGRVRRCHGDLHLRNICLLAGQPVLFDCIEFSDQIACTDVLYDLAFLLMDLIHRGHLDFANIVFNRYLDMTDEADGLRLLPLFLSLRAGVRAHVTARAAGVRSSPEAAAYLHLAAELLKPVPPRLVAVGGLSGTGKSTVAAALAPLSGRAPGARLLRSDVLRKRHFGLAPEAKLPPDAYRPEVNAAIYAMLLAQARKVLDAGVSVILDAVSAKPSERAAFASLAADCGVPFAGLWLEGDPAILAQRIAARRNDASDADAAVLHRQLGYDLGAMDWQRIDAGGTPAVVVAAARRALGIAP